MAELLIAVGVVMVMAAFADIAITDLLWAGLGLLILVAAVVIIAAAVTVAVMLFIAVAFPVTLAHHLLAWIRKRIDRCQRN